MTARTSRPGRPGRASAGQSRRRRGRPLDGFRRCPDPRATAPAPSVPPAGDCAHPYPIASVAVVTPSPARPSARAPRRNRSAARCSAFSRTASRSDIDMIMVRLKSPEIDRVGGIWSGHVRLAGLRRGRPADRRRRLRPLVRTLAGRRRDAVRGHGQLPRRRTAPRSRCRQGHARAIAGPTDVIGAPGRPGLQPAAGADRWCPGCLAAAAGVGTRPALPRSRGPRRPDLWPARARPGRAPRPWWPAATSPPRCPTATSTLGGVGTATSVCGNRVVGFGHPAFFAGKATLPPALRIGASTCRRTRVARLQGRQLRLHGRHRHRRPHDGRHRHLRHLFAPTLPVSSTLSSSAPAPAPARPTLALPQLAGHVHRLPALGQPRPPARRHRRGVGAPDLEDHGQAGGARRRSLLTAPRPTSAPTSRGLSRWTSPTPCGSSAPSRAWSWRR